jgi:hypothetical protein
VAELAEQHGSVVVVVAVSIRILIMEVNLFGVKAYHAKWSAAGAATRSR